MTSYTQPNIILSITHMDRGGSGTIILGHPDGSLWSPPDVRIIVPERPPVHVCKDKAPVCNKIRLKFIFY